MKYQKIDTSNLEDEHKTIIILIGQLMHRLGEIAADLLER